MVFFFTFLYYVHKTLVFKYTTVVGFIPFLRIKAPTNLCPHVTVVNGVVFMTGESLLSVKLFHDPRPRSFDEGQGHTTLFNFDFLCHSITF